MAGTFGQNPKRQESIVQKITTGQEPSWTRTPERMPLNKNLFRKPLDSKLLGRKMLDRNLLDNRRLDRNPLDKKYNWTGTYRTKPVKQKPGVEKREVKARPSPTFLFFPKEEQTRSYSAPWDQF